MDNVITRHWRPYDWVTSVHQGVLSATQDTACSKRGEITEACRSANDIRVLPLEVIASIVLSNHGLTAAPIVKVDSYAVRHFCDVDITAVLNVGFEVCRFACIQCVAAACLGTDGFFRACYGDDFSICTGTGAAFVNINGFLQLGDVDARE